MLGKPVFWPKPAREQVCRDECRNVDVCMNEGMWMCAGAVPRHGRNQAVKSAIRSLVVAKNIFAEPDRACLPLSASPRGGLSMDEVALMSLLATVCTRAREGGGKRWKEILYYTGRKRMIYWRLIKVGLIDLILKTLSLCHSPGYSQAG